MATYVWEVRFWTEEFYTSLRAGFLVLHEREWELVHHGKTTLYEKRGMALARMEDLFREHVIAKHGQLMPGLYYCEINLSNDKTHGVSWRNAQTDEIEAHGSITRKEIH
jgi:hypothetical protein